MYDVILDNVLLVCVLGGLSQVHCWVSFTSHRSELLLISGNVFFPLSSNTNCLETVSCLSKESIDCAAVHKANAL